MTLTEQPQPDITIRSLVEHTLRHWKIIVIAIVICLSLAALYLAKTPKQYLTFFTAGPSESNQTSGVESIIASTAKNSLSSLIPDNQETNDYTYFQNLLTSTAVTKTLSNDARIMRHMFASEWSVKEETWRPTGFKQGLKGALNSIFGYPAYTPPGSYRLAQALQETMIVAKVGKTDLIRVQYFTPDPAFGVYLLDELFKATNDYLKKEKMIVLQKGLNYTQQQFQNNAQVYLKDALSNVQRSMQYQLVMLKADQPFAAVLIDSVTASDRPVKPGLLKTLFLGIVMGFVIGMGIVFLKLLLGRKEFY